MVMKVSVASCLLVVAGIVQASHHEIIQAKWATYKAKHGKAYHATEEAERLKNYLKSTLAIEKHNEAFHRGKSSYKLGHNEFSDRSSEESEMLLGWTSMSLEGLNITDVPPMTGSPLPESVDWRKQNIVTPPKNQGECGSCYAFGTVGAIESAIAQATGQRLNLAEQQVVDCTFEIRKKKLNRGCGGGHEMVVMKYVSEHGLRREGFYRYTSGQTRQHGNCSASGGRFGKGLKFRRVPANDEEAMAQALATYGTLVVSLSAENEHFKLYRSGIYDNPDCPKKPDHLVSLIGYGRENEQDYWILKNSWGTTWGEEGFGRLLRGVNQCGIATRAAWSIYFK